MKDHLITILEAMRLSQVALAIHFQPGGPNAEATIKELRGLLQDQTVALAMEALYLNVESPNTSPGDTSHLKDSILLDFVNRRPKLVVLVARLDVDLPLFKGDPAAHDRREN